MSYFMSISWILPLLHIIVNMSLRKDSVYSLSQWWEYSPPPVDTACCSGSSRMNCTHSTVWENTSFLKFTYVTPASLHSSHLFPPKSGRKVSQDSLCGFIIFRGIWAHFLVEVHQPNDDLKLCWMQKL